MMHPSQMVSQPTSQGGITGGYGWYQPPPFIDGTGLITQQSTSGGLRPQISASDFIPIVTGLLSLFSQQGSAPGSVAAQSTSGGLRPQVSASDFIPIVTGLLSLFSQQGSAPGTPAL